ncbi:MAG: hypothetical protein KF784_14400 [Fimbriimonadaceae bacterium]|nr:hypothetical protein [Fimbriimonadaceae bacterium]
MRRVILIVPDWLSEPDGESVLRQPLPALDRLAEIGQISKISPLQEASVPEAAYLGMNPYNVHLAQGPLTVSALGYDPPSKSLHFDIILMSFVEGGILKKITHQLPTDLPTEIITLLKKLDTRKLTLLEGFDTNHALVWEDASNDLHCHAPEQANGKPMSSVLPEGDGDVVLRRFIDDSINILSEQDFNLRRIDEGLEPINVAWPWGLGYRYPVPNLLLNTGPVQVESPSLRMAGLARLARYKHGDVRGFGQGTAVRLESTLETTRKHGCSIVMLPNIAAFRAAGKLEEMDWLTREFDRRFLMPLVEELKESELRISLLAPSTNPSVHPGLMIAAESHRHGENVYPFDERSLDERLIPTKDVWQAVEDGIRWVVGYEGQG